MLNRVELHARIFLAVKAILEAATDTVGLDIPDKGWALSNLNERFKLYAEEYNHRLGEVKEEPKPWSPGESKLQKALKTLPVIDPDKLAPSDKSMQQLKKNYLGRPQRQMWPSAVTKRAPERITSWR